MLEELARIRTRATTHPSPSLTLQKLVRGEAKLPRKRRLATDALEWEVR